MRSSSDDENLKSGEDVEFLTAGEATAFLVSRLQYSQVAAENVELSATAEEFGIVTKVSIESPVPPGGFSILIKRFRWVIRNDDLNLLDCILEGLRASASAGFFLAAGVAAPARWGALIGLGATTFKVVRSSVLRGKQLDPDLFAVLATLKLAGRAAEDELIAKLACGAADSKWDIAAIQKALDALKAVPMSDGTVRQLVSKDYDGKWQVSGV
jgi:hypothetical protein